MLTDYIAVVTARAGSKRLLNKNMLPLNGIPLAWHSVLHAQEAGLEVVVSTDIPELQVLAEQLGVPYVTPPNADGNHHREQVEHAASFYPNRHVVLLQPTSPFRSGNIIKQCLDEHSQDESSTVMTGRKVYIMGDTPTEVKGVRGNVIIYPKGKIWNYENLRIVRNPICNELEIDTREDYIEACKLALTVTEIPSPIAEPYLSRCLQALSGVGITDSQLIVRDGGDIPQDKPCVYVNHCIGYKGGRVDAVVLVANENILTNPNPELSECIKKAKVAIIRDHQFLPQLVERYPDLKDKMVVIESTVDSEIDSITTGAISHYLLGLLGKVTLIGNTDPVERVSKYKFGNDHYRGGSFDVAIMT